MGTTLFHKYILSLRVDSTVFKKANFPIEFKYDLIQQHVRYMLEVICLQSLYIDHKHQYSFNRAY